MFWRGKARQIPAAAGETDDARAAGDPLDAAATLLRIFGRLGFDLPDRPVSLLQELCEAWARHLLVLAPRPGTARAAPAGRDLAGALQFLSEQRAAETSYVDRAFGDLREALWAFIRGINTVLVEEDAADARVRGQLERLEALAAAGATEALRREALDVSARIAAVLEERRARQRTEAAALGAQVATLGRQLEEAKREGSTDPLTKLHNRRVFDDALPRAVELCTLLGGGACLLLVDADRFKAVNDEHGHAVGDEVLCGIADVLARSFRRRDDLVARLGGEEFVVLLRDTRLDVARAQALQLLEAIRARRFHVGGRPFSVTVSAGLAEIVPGESAAAWFDRADRALYAAKEAGRDRVVEAAAGQAAVTSART